MFFLSSPLEQFQILPLISITLINGKYFSPSFGGRIAPVTVSPVFKPKSLDLNNSEVVHIQTLAKQLKGMGDVTIEVVNHSGDFSSSRKNEKLSRNRALLIKNILVQAGISQENIVAIGLGSYERSFEEILEEDDVSSKNATEFIIKQN